MVVHQRCKGCAKPMPKQWTRLVCKRCHRRFGANLPTDSAVFLEPTAFRFASARRATRKEAHS